MRWSVLFLAACTSFDSVPRDTCGNGVLEAGEDCDSNAATCVHCAVTCTSAGDCPGAAYSCGVDRLCHAPGGALGTPVEGGSFPVDDYRITDVDHDQIGDIVGVSRTSLIVRHGDVGASLSRTDTQVTPSQTGPAAFGDVDNDGTLDVTMATADGMVTYASPFGTLSPLDVQTLITGGGGQIDARMIFSLGVLTVGAFLVDPNNGNVLMGVVDFGNTNQIVVAPLCGSVAAADFSPDLVDVYQVSQDSDVATDAVVALTTRGGKLCVLSVHKDNLLAAAVITAVTPTNPPTQNSKPVLADLDNDNDKCPDVIATDGGSRSLVHWAGAMAGNHCTLSGAGLALPSMDAVAPAAKPFGHASFGGAVFAAPDGLVMPDGIWAYSGGGWNQVYASPRPISVSAIADIDGDGRPDIAVGGGGTSDLDVLYRTNSPFASFQLFRIATAAPVTSISIGDFDGNGPRDVAYSEHVASHERMSVAYDLGTRLGMPVEVATFAAITAIARVQFPSNADPSLQTSDLIVLQAAAGVSALTFLVGSAQRVLIPYYDPRNNTGANSAGQTMLLRTAVVGSFSGGAFRDVLALATPKPTQQGDAAARGWAIRGPIAAFDGTKTDGTSLAGAVDCSHDFGTGFCAEDATYLAWPASGHDVVLGVDANATMVRIDPAIASPGAVAVGSIHPPTGAAVHQLAAADLDGDGKPELLATFDGALIVCTVDAGGTPTSCADAGTVTGATCTDAAAARIAFVDHGAPAPGLDLIAACHDTNGSVLYRIHDAAGTFTADVLVRSSDDLRSVRTGDVNGDGLDDVIAVAGDRSDQTLVVFPQCSTRTLATCQLGAHK